MHPIPHVAARSLRDAAHLEEYIRGLSQRAAVSEVLCIGGGVDHPVGEFSETMQVLETGILQQHGIKRVGVAAHPEGVPPFSAAAMAASITTH